MTDRETDREIELIVAGRHGDPHRVLGLHDGVVRAFRPGASSMRVVAGKEVTDLKEIHPAGLFEGRVDGADDAGDDAAAPLAPDYMLEAVYLRDGQETAYRFQDPYLAWPTLGDVDLHLFGEGRHHRLWEVLGAHYRCHGGTSGVSFAVWAPNAQAVRVVGDWNFWDGRVHQMRSLGSAGVWELFVPGVVPGERYKYEIVTAEGRVVLKTDPMALYMENPPDTASVVVEEGTYRWGDEAWVAARDSGDLLHGPMSVYEMHVGSWRWTDDGFGGRRPLTYQELALELPAYLNDLGFTHVEFMPVAEHPFTGSWGYQVSGYYAPTSRFGTPDDFRMLVDALHQAGIGVLVDWVPAHFPKDDFALARFDGTALYEHSDPRQGEHQDWGTLIFNFGRNEVRNFLLANALFWVEAFHIDGLRVDAVASMLYLDYSRKAGEWVPNRFGGRENLDAVSFLKEVNETVFGLHPGVTVVAEESTAWSGVSRPTYLGGLGFGFKWNMGWMHDTLDYFSHDPVHRRFHHHEITFGLLYAWTENFMLPLSHDEVVHGKHSLLMKMPGDRWQQLANLRALYSWMWAHPGKQLLFMGAELGMEREWNFAGELDWWILDHWEQHRQVRDLLRALNRNYVDLPALWEGDDSPEAFQWVTSEDSDQSVYSFLRLRPGREWDGALMCIANLTPIPRVGYRVGLPVGGRWREILNSDAAEWGGSGMGNLGSVAAEDWPWHGRPHSAAVTLPPLSVLWFTPE